MGMTRDTNDILNRPPVALAPRVNGTVYSYTTVNSSATSTLTAISIQGPGVVNLLYLEPAINQSMLIRTLIDDVTAQSFNGIVGGTNPGVSTKGFAVVGTALSNTLDHVPFEKNFTVLYQCPVHSANFSVSIFYSYRLTE